MSQLHFIHLTGANALFLRERGSTLSIEASITRVGDGDEDALGRFRHQLRRFPTDDFVFVVDSVNEELAAETVPRLRASDLKAMMLRRVDQRARERKLATWRTTTRRMPWPARALAPEGGAEPGTTSVVMGVLGTDGIQPWLDAAIGAQARIADVLSPALLAGGVVRRLRRDAPNGLLAMVTPAGLRQTLIIDGQVRFTRLARLGEAGADSASIASECTRTMQYLLMNQVLPRTMLARHATRVWMVTDGVVDPQALPQKLKADSASEIDVRHVRADELGARRVRGAVPLGLGSAHLLADSRLFTAAGRGYGTTSLRNHHLAAKLARAIVGTGLACATAGALALGGVELVAAIDVQPADPMAARRMQAHRELLELLQRHPVPGSEMRRIVELDRRLRERALDPLVPLQRIASALQEHPGVRLERLSWSRGAESTGADAAAAAPAPGPGLAADAGNALPGAGTLQGGGVAGALQGPGPSSGAIAAPSGPGVDGTAGADASADVDFRIEARIDPLGRKVAANDTARRFVASLSRHCACSVALQTPPFDPSSASGFSADLKRPDTNAQGEFVVALRYAPRGAQRAGAAR